MLGRAYSTVMEKLCSKAGNLGSDTRLGLQLVGYTESRTVDRSLVQNILASIVETEIALSSALAH
jgi:hypothetical protein